MTPTPHGPGWTSIPAKMSKRYAEWGHKDRGLTVAVFAARLDYPASVGVTSRARLTDADAEFVRDAFGLAGGRVRWSRNRKGRECTIIEVQA